MTLARRHTLTITGLAAAAAVLGLFVHRATAKTQDGQIRPFAVRGDQFAYSPGELTVSKDDLVKITFTAVDIPHSFTLDNYRIAKRAGAGQTITFEFRADQKGEFDFYCNLTQDDRCRHMKGRLVVR